MGSTTFLESSLSALLRAVAICLVAVTAMRPSSAAEPMLDKDVQSSKNPFVLADHPKTRICADPYQVGILSKALRVQFESRGEPSADLEEAVALVRIVAPAVDEQRVRFLAFNVATLWDLCAPAQSADFLFWRDALGDWRLTKAPLAEYVESYLASLPTAIRSSAVGAYVLAILGDVREYGGRSGRELSEEAFELLITHGDPDNNLGLVSASLIVQRQKGAPRQEWLDAYARSAGESGEVWDQMPVVKVAPEYPTRALLRQQSGYVVLSFTVDETGRVRNPEVVEESPRGLFTKAAISAARKFRYLPKVVDGKRVLVDGVLNRINFETD